MDFLEKNTDITELSNFHTPAKTRYFFECKEESDIQKLSEIYTHARQKNLPVVIVSGGTNMLFGFETFEGIIVKNSLSGWTYDTSTHILETRGAEKIWEIAESLETDYGQDIWHRFIGLPGSIAGAVYGNAGCFGLETSNNFLDCKVLNIDTGETEMFSKEAMDFSYRNSKLKQEKKYFLLSARFDLSEVVEKYSSDVDNIDFRENRQPKGYSCGSFFKNPSREHSAGSLIEAAGLKGYHLGGAYFSELHANFLMNDGTATHRDLLELIELAQTRVREQFCIELENEVQILTNG